MTPETVMEKTFDSLGIPIQRVGATDLPIAEGLWSSMFYPSQKI